jgi:GNAT superfamily N-acetyltransferase
MEIRHATYLDILNVLPLCRRFQETSGMLPKFDDGAMTNTLWGLVTSPDTILLLAVDDERIVGICGLKAESPYWSNEISVHELFWYVDEEYRGRAVSGHLFKAAEEWATKTGAVELLMGALASTPYYIRQVYEMAGYAEMQTSYAKRLNHNDDAEGPTP